jgi:hypothetical protein
MPYDGVIHLEYGWEPPYGASALPPIIFFDVEAEAKRQAEAIRVQWLAVRLIEIACEGKRQAQPFQPQNHECIDTWGTIRPKLEGVAVSYLPYGLTEATQPNAPEMKLWQPRGKTEMGFKHPPVVNKNFTPLRWSQRFTPRIFTCWFDPLKVPNRDFLYSEWVSLLSERPTKQKPAERTPPIRFPLPKPNEDNAALGITITESNGGSAWRGELIRNHRDCVHKCEPCLHMLEHRYPATLATNRISRDQLTFLRKKALITRSQS